MRRLPVGLIALAAIGLLLLPTITNVAADNLPHSWKPYLWLAWPVALILGAPAIYIEVRERHRLHGAVGLDDRGPEDSRDALSGKARRDLATAVRDQWTEEAGVRSLCSPEPIRVRWHSRLGAGRSGDVLNVVGLLRQIPSRQLVILGGPASGKTVMALLLTLDLLPDEADPDLVPVLLPISSWNPRAENLHTWVARRIVEEYPALANSNAYGPDAATRLVIGKQVMPVLDGLDEMAEALRSAAIAAIGAAITDRFPLVLTSRTDEYEAAVNKSGRTLAHAESIEIQPGNASEAMNFVRQGIPEPGRWQPVADYLEKNPDSPLTCVLSSPLMVDLARTVYGRVGENPEDLLQFPDQPAIEHHLIGEFLTTAYDQPFVRRQPRSPARYDAGRAGTWLRFLADCTRRRGQPDIAWWHLEHAVPRAALGTLIGVVLALVTGSAEGYIYGPFCGLTWAVTFGLATSAAAVYGSTRSPSRITVRFRGNEWSLLARGAGGFAMGCGLMAIGASLGGLLWGGVLGAAFMVHLWLGAPPDVATEATPAGSLRDDRNAALVFGATLSGALIFGTLLLFAVTPMASYSSSLDSISPVARALTGIVFGGACGAVGGGFFYGKAGAVAYGTAFAVVTSQFYGSGRFPVSEWTGMVVAGVVMCMMVGCLGIVSRAWGTYMVARLYLALRGRLPWHLMRFLDDARNRGVLRQSGKVYQFRHELLREYLAVNEEPEPRGIRETVG